MYESEDYRKGNSSESEQYLYTGNGLDQFSKVVTSSVCNDKSDNFGVNSSGSDEFCIASEQMDDQPERHASPAEAFKICAWNVTGLWNKLTDPKFVMNVQLFDVICLWETFVDYLNAEIFPGHSVFLKPAIKLDQLERRSGGVIALVRKELTVAVVNVEVEYDNILMFKVAGNIFKVDRDVSLICCYVCPRYSPYYRDKDLKRGLHFVEECIMHVNENCDCPVIIVYGNLNSRPADSSNYCSDDIPDENTECGYESGGRKSMDKTVNTFGSELLNMLCLQTANPER